MCLISFHFGLVVSFVFAISVYFVASCNVLFFNRKNRNVTIVGGTYHDTRVTVIVDLVQKGHSNYKPKHTISFLNMNLDGLLK